jgi:hypothetical protein
MQWINENDLARWAKFTNARTLLADMVADLIRATIADAARFRFPGGDVGQVRGWDGDLETTEAISFVPAGKSKWEFGVGAGAAKASSDYDKRTAKTDVKIMEENTLLLVNLEVWDTPREMLTKWEDDRNAEGKWLRVRYLDAVELVHWLDEHPAVAALYAREVLQLAPKSGALSTDEFWEMYSLQFEPQLNEKVVVADRQSVADELLQKLAGPPQSIMIGAETSDEVVAFAVAAIRLAKPEVRRWIEVRTLIIESESAARFLSQSSDLIFITRTGGDSMAGVLAQRAPTLSAATGTQARKPQIQVLQRATASSMSEGFESMGLDRQAGYELAHRCGRSLTILRRLISRGPCPYPAWEPSASLLKPAFLAGGWSGTTELDKQILEMLSGLDYTAIESQLLPTLAQSDPPLDRVKEYWQVRAPVDAFSVYGRLLSEDDLQRFRKAVIQVFSHIVTGPSRDEKFSLTYNSPADYSKWLRDGLALTLLIMATMHDVGGLQMNATTPQQYVDDILSALPNWGKSHETLVGLNDQSALWAEAAPNPFLMALESMLEGAPGEVAKIFSASDDDIWSSRSPHVNVLWALETLAWDPKYLNRTAVILAKLAELDQNPGSRMISRPINSLRSILLSWSPNTYAPLMQRIVCLDLILASCPDAGWQLLMQLMPHSYDTCSPTQKPKLRDTAPMVQEEMTFGLVWDSEAAIASRAMQAAGDDEERIVLLVKQVSSFQPATRSELLAFIDSALSRHYSAEGSPIWHALREEVTRHEYFADADWAIKQEECDTINAILERHRPTDPLLAERQLFDDWTPYIGRYAPNKDDDDFDVQRALALDRIMAQDGVAGILRLARLVRIPRIIGPSLRLTSIKEDEDQLFELLEASIATEAPGELSFWISAIGAEQFGERWRKRFKENILKVISDPQTIVGLMLGWSLEVATWEFVKSLGEDIYDEYWRRMQGLPVSGTLDDLLFAIEEFRRVSRSLEVLGLVHSRMGDLSSKLILSLLVDGHQQAESCQHTMGTMLPYYLNKAFEALQARGDVKEEDIARQEFSYLPLLVHEKRSLVLLDFLSRDPAFYVEVLSHVFRAKNAPRDTEPTEQERARANVSYRLISMFKTVPGLINQSIDSEILNKWVDGVRECAVRANLGEIADQYVGQILAHAPVDPADDFWPPASICDLIERVGSTELENGFRLECFNKRGVITRGIYQGGTRERADAATYLQWSALTARYPRTSAMLAAISETWRRHAEDADVRAELHKMER